MVMSTFQKVTLATCLVLCVALLLPKLLLSRGRKDAAERPEGSGRFPPMMHRQMAPEARSQRAASAGFSRAHNTEAINKAKGAGTGAGPGTGGKSNLAGQIIPVYGFGILLYILYILFKITSKGTSKPAEGRFPSVRSENMKRKITDFELAQLQEKLRETELVMENIVSNVQHSPDSVKGVMADQEESLLQQLTEITRAMQEGQMVDAVSPEKKEQDDWGDYQEEPHQYWDYSRCCCHSQHHYNTEAAAETAAERTEGDGADVMENVSADDVIEEAADADIAAGSEDVEPEVGGADIDLGVPDEDLPGVLKELELTLKMTTMMEQEKMEDLVRPVEDDVDVGVAQSHVRRRNKRRRAKKTTH